VALVSGVLGLLDVLSSPWLCAMCATSVQRRGGLAGFWRSLGGDCGMRIT
jgi:hypothetical protein